MIADINANSHVSIHLMSHDFFSNEILEEHAAQISELSNIKTVNRTNRLELTLYDHLYIEPGRPPAFGQAFPFAGIDDLATNGPFFTEIKRIQEGRLELSGNEIVVFYGLSYINNWEVGTVLPFRLEDGAIMDVVIAGMYHIFDAAGRENPFSIYASPDLINVFQDASLYSNVQFFVENPSETEVAKGEIRGIIRDADYHISVFDDLYQRMKMPIEGLRQLVEAILYVSLGTTGVVVSLLLALWVRERRRETAILLSIGETKKAIILQRLLEVTMIFLLAFIAVVLANHFVIPNLGTLMSGMITTSGSIALQQPNFYLTIADLLHSLVLGSAIILVSVLLATLPLIKTHPKSILASAD